MNKQISLLDSIRLFFCFIIAFVVYDFIFVWGWSIGAKGSSGMEILLLKSLLGIALSAFSAILIGSIFVSWRLKLIAGTLILYVIIAGRIFDLINSFDGIWILLGSLVRLSSGLIGALGAIFFWRAMKNARKKKSNKPIPADLGERKGKHRISIFLLILSLLSVPATYIAMFVSAFVAIGISALILILFFQSARIRIPIFIIIAVFLAPLVAAVATFKALWAMFFPKTTFQSAIPLKTVMYPTLNSIIDEVCKKVGTKKPTSVVLHAEPTFFVMSGKLATFDGAVKGRILALGMPLLKNLTLLEIKSILAHEFAHFSGSDTLYSSIVSPVYRGIISSMKNLGVVGDGAEDSSVSNTMRLLLLTSSSFLGIFLEYFATIDMILSRNRELRADQIAARLYGRQAFSNALIKVIRISSHFNEASFTVARGSGSNFFTEYNEHLEKDENQLRKYEESVLAEKETEFDSHPSLTTRLTNLPEGILVDPKLDSMILEEDLGKELLEKEKELAQKYTEQAKVIAKYYEQYLEDTTFSDPIEESQFDEERENCPDESCTGIIQNGQCTECGRKA